MEWVSKYFDGNIPFTTTLGDYAQTLVTPTRNYVQALAYVSSQGPDFDATSLRAFVGNYFTYTVPTDLFVSINNGNPVMGTLIDPATGTGHEVIITGYVADGSMQYFDPQTGTYPTPIAASNFHNVTEITGLKH